MTDDCDKELKALEAEHSITFKSKVLKRTSPKRDSTSPIEKGDAAAATILPKTVVKKRGAHSQS
jgi:hypothetical protein